MVTADSIETAEVFGSPYVYEATVNLISLDQLRTLTSLTYTAVFSMAEVLILNSSIESSQSVSEPVVGFSNLEDILCYPEALDTEESVSALSISYNVEVDGISSEEVFGDLTAETELKVFLEGISSDESVESVTLNVTIYVDSSGTEEFVSDIYVTNLSYVDSVLSEEYVSEILALIDLFVYADSIDDETVFGDLLFHRTIELESISDSSAVGNPALTQLAIVGAASIDSEASVSEPALRYSYKYSLNSSDFSVALPTVVIHQTVRALELYESSVVNDVRVSLMTYVDAADSACVVSDLTANLHYECSMSSVEDSDAFDELSITQEAFTRPTHITSKESFGRLEVGVNGVIFADSIASANRIQRVHVHHVMDDLHVDGDCEVPDVSVVVHVPTTYPLSVLSQESFNNPLCVIDGVAYAYSIYDDTVVDNVSISVKNLVDADSTQTAEEFGTFVLSLTMTSIAVESIASAEDVFEGGLVTEAFVPRKALDWMNSDSVITTDDLYGAETVTRIREDNEWVWELYSSFWSTRYLHSETATVYSQNIKHVDGQVVYEPSTIVTTFLVHNYLGLSYEVWQNLIYAHQMPWNVLNDHYYGYLERWILEGSNYYRTYAADDSSTVVVDINGDWRKDPLTALVPVVEGLETVNTNLSFVDDKISELRSTSPAGLCVTTTPQSVQATISAVTTEATDTLEVNAEYIIDDQVANYDLYEGISVAPMTNYMFDIPEPSYVMGVPIIPALRTDSLCFVDIVNTVHKISADSSSKLSFFGVAPDIIDGTETPYDSVDDLPKSLYDPDKPMIVTPEDPTSEWDEGRPLPENQVPTLPGTWEDWKPDEEDEVTGDTSGWLDLNKDGLPDGWVDTDGDGIPDAFPGDMPPIPEGWEDVDDDGIPDIYDPPNYVPPDENGDGSDEDWEETQDGVTPSSGTKSKSFPLNLFGGGTVILSGIPKYQSNGKKKWLFVTGKKKPKKNKDTGLCVDESEDEGARYIGLYFRNGNLVLTDGQFVLRTKAPPRGQRALIFAGYYGTRSFVGWWCSPTKYKYRFGEMYERDSDKNGVTILKIGKGWGIKSPGDIAGNGMTIGSITIIDESAEVGSLGDADTRARRTTPTATLEDFAKAKAGKDGSDEDAATEDGYVADPSVPDPKADDILERIREWEEQRRDLLNEKKDIEDLINSGTLSPEEQADAELKLNQIATELSNITNNVNNVKSDLTTNNDTERLETIKSMQDLEIVRGQVYRERDKIRNNLAKYGSVMPADKKQEAMDALSGIEKALKELNDMADEYYKPAIPPHWVPVSVAQSDEYKQYVSDYSKWKIQPRMIGYFSIDDSSRVGVPGVR